MRSTEKDLIKRWIDAWRAAGPELERMRADELSAMTEEESALVFDGLGFEPGDIWVPEERVNSEGLIEQQRLFMRSHEHPASRRRRA